MNLNQERLAHDFDAYREEFDAIIRAQAPLDQEALEQIRNSIKLHRELGQGYDGLLEPIDVFAYDNGQYKEYWVLDGRYRLMACKLLGDERITCNLHPLPSNASGWYRAMLIAVDRQVVRRQLSIIERGELLITRLTLLRRLGLAAKKSGDNQHTLAARSRAGVRIVADLASEANMSRRSFQLASQLATQIMPDVKVALQAHDLPIRDLLAIATVGDDQPSLRSDNPTKAQRQQLTNLQQEKLQELLLARQLQKSPPVPVRASAPARLADRRSASKAVSTATATVTEAKVLPFASTRRKPEIDSGHWLQIDNRHSVFCGSTSGGDFADYAPDAELAIARVLTLDQDQPIWEHDWLADKARVLVVIAAPQTIVPFVESKRMPYRGATQVWMHEGNRSRPSRCLEIFIFSHSMVIDDHLLKPLRVSSWEELYMQLMTPFTKNGSNIILPELSEPALKIAHQIGRRCYLGSNSTEDCTRFVENWCEQSPSSSVRPVNLRATVAVG